MRIWLIWMLIILATLAAGCAKDKPPVAALEPLPAGVVGDWGIPDNLTTTGEGNSYRIVLGASLGADAALELVAGGRGNMEYFRETAIGLESHFACRLQFLSTQGSGRIKLSAFDAANRVVATLGWIFTGQFPDSDSGTKWLDQRYGYNYEGNWVMLNGNPAELFARYLPQVSLAGAVKYRLSIEVGQGQHALVTACQLTSLPKVKLTPQAKTFSANVGELVTLAVDIENTGDRKLDGISVEAVEPYGYGLVVAANRMQVVDNLGSGEKRTLVWQIRAQRPDGVNMGQPWPVSFSVNGTAVQERISIAVTDPRPGKIFYVMTDDLEPIDSAGYSGTWGNADGWLESGEFITQMVTKAEKVNSIAERYGAKWTHYIAWPAVKAAEWAAGKSSSGQWPEAVAAIKQSVREQSARGHEYGAHLHADYDPYLPGNVLSYNPVTDGIWANHLRHGWAHSLPAEGSPGDSTSRTGMLFDYQSILDELAVSSPYGQLVTSRAGSFDFGNGPADEALSIRVYRKVGLLAGSDADGNSGGITAGDYGREIYLTRTDDINTLAADLKEVGMVEFRPTPREFIKYDKDTASVMNQKAAQGIAYFAPGGAVRPGVHAIIGFTHVMFMMGDGDWQSTQNGQFAVLDKHLSYLKEQYVDKGLLSFATASELVKEYLDYYSPRPVAVYGRRLSDSFGVAEYAIVILGRDIPVDAAHPHAVTVKYPIYLRSSAYRVSVLKNGEVIFSTWGLPTPFNDIAFTVDDAQAHYSLKVYHNEHLYRGLTMLRGLKTKIGNLSL